MANLVPSPSSFVNKVRRQRMRAKGFDERRMRVTASCAMETRREGGGKGQNEVVDRTMRWQVSHAMANQCGEGGNDVWAADQGRAGFRSDARVPQLKQVRQA